VLWLIVSLMSWGGVTLSPLGARPLFGPLYQLPMIDVVERGAVSGTRIARGNRSNRGKPALLPLFPPQISHDLT
jgi:hypothetical protein